jgi:superfamily II RNA helicase
MDDTGHVVVRLDLDSYHEYRPLLRQYDQAAYEPVRSSFSLSWNSVINLLERHERSQIQDLVNKSFLAWHLRHQAKKHLTRAKSLEGGSANDKKETRRLERRAERAETRCWDEFRVKVHFLQDIGYLGPEADFRAGALVLRHVQISEILVTELVLTGLLETLDGPTLFGLACALTNDLPRSVNCHYKLNRDDRQFIRAITDVRFSAAVTQAEKLTEVEVTWCPDLLPLGRGWATGRSLTELLSMLNSKTDYAGSLVTGFRRAKDLLSQLRDVYKHDEERSAVLRSVLKSVSRDEVEVVG